MAATPVFMLQDGAVDELMSVVLATRMNSIDLMGANRAPVSPGSGGSSGVGRLERTRVDDGGPNDRFEKSC